MNVSKSFEGWFTFPNENEPDFRSYSDFYEMRYNDLSKTITIKDYEINP